MNGTDPHPVIAKLRQAGAVHSRHRAWAFLLRSFKWIVIAIPLLMLADVLLQFSETFRLLGLLGILVAFAAVSITAAVLAIFIRPPLLRIARLLESRNPALGSKLINFLQLENEVHSETSSELTRSLAAQAVDDAGRSIDPAALPEIARDPGLRQRFLNAAIAPALLLLLTLAGGSWVRHEWTRFLDPFGDHPPFSLTRIVIQKPLENSSVLYGGSIVVEARTSGHQPRELFLTASGKDASSPPITLPMIPRGDGTFIAALEKIRQPLQLTAHSTNGNSRSRHRDLGVIYTPQIGPALVRVTPPAYTGQTSRELPFRFSGLQALEGSEISFQLKSNRPLGAGKISLLTAPESSVEFPFEPTANSSADTATGTFNAETSGRLSFAIVDVDGNAASEIPTSVLTVTRDQPPAIATTTPEKDAFIVENLAIPIAIDATDDYGLRSVRLHVSVNGTFLPIEPLRFEGPDTRRHQLKHPLDLAAASAKAGDEIVIFAEAIDTRPDPQMTRTGTRRLAVITEQQYNDYLRKQSDVAMIAGKYEQLLERLQQHVEAQRRIEETREKLAKQLEQKPEDESAKKQLAETAAEQERLNAEIDALADEMNGFGRENPVYDFESGLQQTLKRQAAKLRQSTERNRSDNAQAGEQPQPLAEAAQAHRERLEGGRQEMKKEVIEPLEDLSQLHELMKDFNLFKQLTEEQKRLADQTKAYEQKEPLTPEDKLALKDLGATQRQQAQALEALGRKLRADAAAAKDSFPKAAGSAGKLADAIEKGGLPGMARSAAGEMLAADAADSHPQAKQLYDRMNKLFCDSCQPGQSGTQEGFDQALKLARGMNPGNSFQQMMQSLNFRPSPADGNSGAGSGGFMANSATDGTPNVIGGESLMNGPIARSLAGRGDQGGPGMAGAPTARLDQADAAGRGLDSSRRTQTPTSGSILLEYEKIADAYFRRLTTPP